MKKKTTDYEKVEEQLISLAVAHEQINFIKTGLLESFDTQANSGASLLAAPLKNMQKAISNLQQEFFKGGEL